MRSLVFMFVLLTTAPAMAATYCLPKNGKDRIAKAGTCPSGYFASGDCCEAFRAETKRAFPKQGSTCPPGSFSSSNYCVGFR